MEFYSETKRKDLLVCSAMWMNLRNCYGEKKKPETSVYTILFHSLTVPE